MNAKKNREKFWTKKKEIEKSQPLHNSIIFQTLSLEIICSVEGSYIVEVQFSGCKYVCVCFDKYLYIQS